MEKKSFLFEKIIISSLLLIFLSQPAFSIRKNNKESSVDSESVDVVITSSEPIKLPSVGKKSYFSKIDSSILADVENGSPSSIKSAIRRLHKSSEEYTENEKVLIYVASSIMEIVWPSENITWAVLPLSTETQYSEAIKSVKNGIYDSSTGNTDFLTSILPALVLLNNPSNANIQQFCFESIAKAMEYNSHSVLAYYLLGKYYSQNGDIKQAQNYFAKAYEMDDSCFEISIAYSKALNENGNYNQSTEVVKKLAEKNPDNLDVLKQNSYIAFEHGDLALAEDYVNRILQQVPNDMEFVLFRAKIFIEKKDYIHSISLLDLCAKQDDNNLDYLLLRTKVQMDWSRNYNAATQTIEKAVRLYPKNKEVLLLAAKISSHTDSPVDGKYADELAGVVLESDPENSAALFYALDGMIQRENWKRAYEVSSRLMNDENPSPEVILRHVKVCIKNGKTTEALDIATKAYNQDKTDENNIQSYVYAYVNRYSRDNSINLINNLMDTSTQKIKSFLYLRRSYLQKTEEKILSDLRSSLIANPRNDEALFRLYEIYYSKKDYRKAQYYLRQVVAIKPNDQTIKALNDSLSKLIK